MLSKSIADNEQLGSVSLEADYLFARCIPHLDREGRMSGNPALVKSKACPLRPEIDSGSIPDLLRQLSGAGLVRWYETDGKQVLEFPGFKNHQKGFKFDREAESRFPAADSPGAIDLSGASPDLLRTYSGPTPDQVPLSRSEVEVEVKEKGRTRAGRAHPLPDDWMPKDDHIRLANERRVSAAEEATKMRDWAAAEGKVKRDWDAAFRNWLRRAEPARNGKGGDDENWWDNWDPNEEEFI